MELRDYQSCLSLFGLKICWRWHRVYVSPLALLNTISFILLFVLLFSQSSGIRVIV